MRLLTLLAISSIILSCSNKKEVLPAQKDKNLTNYVNTFIGTGGHGHTYPGATMPFGMMQLSPDTRLEGWDGCSGYHYDDEYIYGFSHTHLSGTGVSDYGDVLLMPTTSINFHNGADGKSGYRDHFSHENEEARPGYYKVHLDNTDIDVELTVTKRAGMHKYAFAKADSQHIILDLEHRDKLLDAKINIISDTEISGYRISEAWAQKQMLYYYLKTSHSFTIQKPVDTSQKAALTFNNPNNDPIYLSVGISAVDEAGAKRNLETEIGSKTFDQIRLEAEKTWEKQLEKVVIESEDLDYKTNFYSALYHTMIAPNLYQDVDGRYRGMDLEIHQTQDFDYYTVFSLWDTYRAAHPLYTIIEQDRTNDFINTFLAKYDEGGIMPIWDLSANYTGCMIGYHAVPVIADAYMKGIRDYDPNKALEAMIHSATRNHLGLDSYKDQGFISVEEESESVSKTLEYAYDDWTISQMAQAMGDNETYSTFTKRAQAYKNVFDPETKFMRGRFRNTWFAPFDPYEVNFNYTEANSWQYSFYVPQDITGFTNLLGGKEQLETQLDELFTAKASTSGRDQADITGLIGQYAHGNEPSHHMAYLYNFVNKPHKTQERVREILTTLYHNDPDGVSGNEDCGQMSAWYVLSSLGFYPVTPGSNEYVIGTPLFDKASIHLENGKTFTIIAENVSESNKYIEAVQLNGKNYPYTYLNHKDIVNGGTLVFTMTNTPSSWGINNDYVPSTEIKDHIITPAPYITQGEIAFKNKTVIALESAEKDAQIFYALGEEDFKKYVEPFSITEATVLKTYAIKNEIESPAIETRFFKKNPNLSIVLDSEYANQYNAGGEEALIDGILGTRDFRTGTWQGYQTVNLGATVDLGNETPINTIAVNFLRDQRSWIFLPNTVSVEGSVDGKKFEVIETIEFTDNHIQAEDVIIKNVKASQINKTYRYIRLRAQNIGKLPEWHLGYPNTSTWIFVDEIIVN